MLYLLGICCDTEIGVPCFQCDNTTIILLVKYCFISCQHVVKSVFIYGEYIHNILGSMPQLSVVLHYGDIDHGMDHQHQAR